MQFRVNRADERPVYIQIVDEVRSSLILGLLKPGDPLPSIRKLATTLGINQNTVRQAYLLLREHAIVELRQGSGSYISETLNNLRVLDRDQLLRDIATRSLRTANRHGFSVVELVGALQRVETALTPAAWTSPAEGQPGHRD